MNPQFFTPGKKLILLVVIGFAVLFSVKILGPSLAKNNEEREIENKIPKHLPLKVKLKKEKEAKVKDFKNDAWLPDFELEVTNTSEKPIYYLSMYLLFPEFVVPNGGVKGIPLRYGRMDFVKSATRPLPDDIPIKPGETYTFKIPDQDLQAWSNRKAAGLARNPRKLQFIFASLSFGDGTGCVGTTGLPYPRANQISQAEADARCLEQRAQKQEGRGDVWIGPPDLAGRGDISQLSNRLLRGYHRLPDYSSVPSPSQRRSFMNLRLTSPQEYFYCSLLAWRQQLWVEPRCFLASPRTRREGVQRKSFGGCNTQTRSAQDQN